MGHSSLAGNHQEESEVRPCLLQWTTLHLKNSGLGTFPKPHLYCQGTEPKVKRSQAEALRGRELLCRVQQQQNGGQQEGREEEGQPWVTS